MLWVEKIEISKGRIVVATGRYNSSNWRVWPQQIEGVIIVKKDVSLVKSYF